MTSPSVQEIVVAALPDLYALRSRERFPVHALSVIRRLVGGDKGEYTEVDLVTGRFQVLVDPLPPRIDEVAEARRTFMPQHPVLRAALAGQRGVVAISDFYSPRDFHRTPLYGEVFSITCVEHQLTLIFTDAPGQAVCGVSVDRQRPGFGSREREMMELLLPHVLTAQQNAARLSQALVPGQPVYSDRVGRLTDRQVTVLEQIAAGATNQQIAGILGISEGTVRKHLEQILQRLEVSSRTAAAMVLAREEIAAEHWTASLPGLLS